MQDLIPPELTDKDFHQVESHEWLDLASRWKRTNTQLKALEEEEKRLRDGLISLCSNQSSIGGGVKVTRFLRKGSVDYAKIPQLKGLDIEKFRKKPVECWKIGEAK